MNNTSPETYHLHKRTILREIDTNHIAIVKKIKSRIISKDAKKIIDQVKKIKSVDPLKKVSLVCTKNICSKSIALLHENNVEIFYEDI
ncbi:MAG: hypothetical protein JW717_07625 [Marinilabiliaceae bacterium]|nr:hypothetical protein [Marinilabiliaceae bacterium]